MQRELAGIREYEEDLKVQSGRKATWMGLFLQLQKKHHWSFPKDVCALKGGTHGAVVTHLYF